MRRRPSKYYAVGPVILAADIVFMQMIVSAAAGNVDVSVKWSVEYGDLPFAQMIAYRAGASRPCYQILGTRSFQ